MPDEQATPDFRELTEGGRKVWSSGDFNEIARQTMMIAEDVCRAADPRPGQAVLDVACGSGNLALVAARRYSVVSGIDIAANLVERSRSRAEADGLEVDFRVGDAQDLPYPDAQFDIVTSAFGAMFAPDQKKTADELARVCRPGGKIVLANWMPEAFGGDFFGAHARHAPPPPGAASPLRWGSEAGIHELLGEHSREISFERRAGYAYYRSVEHALDLFQRYFGPTIRALGIVREDGADALRRDLAAVFEKHNTADDGTVVMRTDYLQTTAIRA